MCSQSITAHMGSLPHAFIGTSVIDEIRDDPYLVRVQVGALEEAQLAVHRQRAAEALAKQEALEQQGATDATSDAALSAEPAGKKEL